MREKQASLQGPFFEKLAKVVHTCYFHGLHKPLEYYLNQAAIAKYYRLGGLNNEYLFLTVLEAGKSKIKVPSDLVSGESS